MENSKKNIMMKIYLTVIIMTVLENHLEKVLIIVKKMIIIIWIKIIKKMLK